jgi:hypothetical protein
MYLVHCTMPAANLAATRATKHLVCGLQMDSLLQAAPEECRALVCKFEAQGEQYRGFCMSGEADVRGEWKDASGILYVGDWR